MTTWNFRVLAHKEGEDVLLQIHRVYYDEQNKPVAYSEKGVEVYSESVEGIEWVLNKMKECLTKPILSAKDFPNEYISAQKEEQ